MSGQCALAVNALSKRAQCALAYGKRAATRADCRRPALGRPGLPPLKPICPPQKTSSSMRCPAQTASACSRSASVCSSRLQKCSASPAGPCSTPTFRRRASSRCGPPWTIGRGWKWPWSATKACSARTWRWAWKSPRCALWCRGLAGPGASTPPRCAPSWRAVPSCSGCWAATFTCRWCSSVRRRPA